MTINDELLAAIHKSDVPTVMLLLLGRIEVLEAAQTSVDCERVHRDMAEDERQERWHATRDAYVTGSLANPDCSDDDEKILRLASKFADLAHGQGPGHSK